jgi:hypothetical protein
MRVQGRNRHPFRRLFDAGELTAVHKSRGFGENPLLVVPLLVVSGAVPNAESPPVAELERGPPDRISSGPGGPLLRNSQNCFPNPVVPAHLG